MPIPAQAYYRHTMASMPTRSCSPLSRKPRIEVTDTGIFRIARKPSGVANARCPGRNALHDPGAERGARPSGQFHGAPGAAPDQTETEHGRRRGIQFRSRLTSRCCTPGRPSEGSPETGAQNGLDLLLCAVQIQSAPHAFECRDSNGWSGDVSGRQSFLVPENRCIQVAPTLYPTRST